MIGWLLKAGGYTVFLRVIAMVMTLVFVSAFSIWMDKADFGILTLIIATTTLAASVGGFGQSEQLIRDMPAALAEENEEKAQIFLKHACARVFWISLPLGFVVGVYFSLAGYGGLWVGAVTMLITILLSLNLAWSGAARSRDMYLWALAPKDIFWRFGALIICGVVVLSGRAMGIDFAATVLAITLLIPVFFQARVLGIKAKDLFLLPKGDEAQWRVGFDLMLSSVAIAAQSTVDVFLIGLLMSEISAAEYFPANRLALVAGFFAMPFQLVLAPRLSRMVRQGDLNKARRLNMLSVLVIFAATACVATAMIWGYDLYIGAFATATNETRVAFVILAIGQILVTLMGFPAPVLIASGYQTLMARQNLIFFVIGSLAMAVAAAGGKIEWVAAAAAFGIVGRKFVIMIACGMKTGIWPFHLGWSRK